MTKYYTTNSAKDEYQVDVATDNFMVVIKMESDHSENSETYNYTLPLMPWVIDDLGVFQLKDYYAFVGAGLDVNIPNPEEDHRIVLVNTNAGARLYSNGYCYAKGAKLPAIKNLRVGHGYKNRAWSGNMKEFYVVELPNGYVFNAENCHYAHTEQMDADGKEILRIA